MRHIANSRCREIANRREEFKGSNLQGKWVDKRYVIESYGWYPIFVYDPVTDKWYECNDGYSMSTKKQMGQCRPEQKTVVVDRDTMRSLAAGF